MGNCGGTARVRADPSMTEAQQPRKRGRSDSPGGHTHASRGGTAYPALRKLLTVCVAVSTPMELQQQARVLGERAPAALADMQALLEAASAASPDAPDPAAVSLRASVQRACCACINVALQPLLPRIEAAVAGGGQGAATRTAGNGAGAGWDAVTAAQLLAVMRSALDSSYGPGGEDPRHPEPPSRWVGRVLHPLARLLLLAWQHQQLSIGGGEGSAPQASEGGASNGGSPLQKPAPLGRHDPAIGAPAVDSLVSMVSLVMFRRVVPEPQASLDAKMQSVKQLAAMLGLDVKSLAACCSGPQRVALLRIIAPASTGKDERRLRLTVRRSAAFWDALRVLRDAGVLLATDRTPCKLFPAFLQEWDGAVSGAQGPNGAPAVEEGEGHGPRKEFFLLAAENAVEGGPPTLRPASRGGAASGGGASGGLGAQAPSAQEKLLVYNREAGTYWYNIRFPQSKEREDAFFCLGWLAGQSLLNHAPLGIPLPSVMVMQMVKGLGGFTPTLADLTAFDPAAAGSIRRVLRSPPNVLAVVMEQEGLARDAKPEAYIARSVKALLVSAVSWQASAMAGGFQAALDVSTLDGVCVGAAELSTAMAGGHPGGTGSGPPPDLRAVFRVVTDLELSRGGAGEVVANQLWEVVAAWSSERRAQFVEFVTGSRRLPLPGTELLKIECPFVALGGVTRQRELLATLPQAHTCDNLLELPNYWQALLQVRGHGKGESLTDADAAMLRAECRRVLQERLETALDGCLGYGLDDSTTA